MVELADKNVTFPKSQDFEKILRSHHRVTVVPVKRLESKVLDSITRTLNFYDSQLGDITKGDTSIALKTLKGKCKHS